MIYRKKTYKIKPEKLETFNGFFHEYLLPNQLKNGSRLIGRWVNENQDEITAIWQYESYEAYKKIEEKVRQDPMNEKAQKRRKEIGDLYLESKQDFLTETGEYRVPKHIVTAFAYITNEKGETLLVKTFWRDDTYELPGGQVEEGEPLDVAVAREVKEETGIEVKIEGVTGVYSNLSSRLVTVGFIGKAVGGKVCTSSETKEVIFIKLNEENIGDYFTREHFKVRTVDAMNCRKAIPYESYKKNPYQLVTRTE
ncbi:NUDIX domain-containing protein [Pseudalkalibacillus caeni]|uniref:NUDIX domain-containing protein n=1 Tax=Exobacillus caeni TaxID=2574798 RepID=A0A5R9FAR9_9BACL|nr:NUDIX domain-containing protein [Pseudalkalibacillus caeni]TLS38758.1 NUDIX domain-containing protein [Pseudalkalibacillus caeni]